jgi:hypothetical protein
MGFGFPAAMGIKLNFPDHDVACVTGEGSIQMNIQELSTCLQYGLPVKIVNLNNGAGHGPPVAGHELQQSSLAFLHGSRCRTSSSWPKPMVTWHSASPIEGSKPRWKKRSP